MLVDPLTAPTVTRAFELSASGLTDRQVAAAVDLKLTHVREVLKNPVYTGKLRGGEVSGAPALITPALWDRVIISRARYARRNRGPVNARTYPLSTLLVCASCGRRLTGHVGRYRHVDACADFKAAAPETKRGRGDPRHRGESYKAEVYDKMVPQVLDRVSVGAGTLASVIGGLAALPDTSIALARIELEREAAMTRYRRDRDATSLDRAMRALDVDEAAAAGSVQVVSAESNLAWLRDLPALWAAGDDSGRRLLTESLFEKVEVLGVRSVMIHATEEAEAHGWSAAFGTDPMHIAIDSGARGNGTDGRGERI